MMLLHAADGWLRPGLKDGLGWMVIRTVGGQAAPLFLLLAGVGIGIGWANDEAAREAGRGNPARARVSLASRGLEIVLAGYALRLVMWWIDSGALVRPAGYLGGAALALGYFGAFRALTLVRMPLASKAPYEPARDPRLWAIAAIGVVGLALRYVANEEPTALGTLLRPDVLHTIGVAMAIIALLEPLLRGRLGLAWLLAVGVTLLTPILSERLPGAWPGALAGYLAPYPQIDGGPLPGRFPLCPWLAHALVGAALGQAWGRAARLGRGEEAAIEWAVLGALLALVCCESVPETASLLVREPYLTPTVRVGYRIGLSLVLGALCVLLAQPRWIGQRSLMTLGRASLFVYCVHLELAFGLAAEPIRRSLGYAEFGLGTLLLVALMTGLSHVWLRARARARARARITEAKLETPCFQSSARGL